MRSRHSLGIGLTAAGACLSMVGTVGLAVDRPSTTTSAATATTSSSTSVSTPSPTPSPSPSIASESPAQFLDLFGAAIRNGDIDFLFTRLHPAVIQRFGAQMCRTTLAARPADPTARFTVKQVAAPAPYDWRTGTSVTTVPDTLAVTVDRISHGVTAPAVIHLTPVAGQLRWFTDCSLR